jgi:hypothetical protein
MNPTSPNPDNLRGGRFSVQRAIFDHMIWKTAPAAYFRIWLYLFGMAAWKSWRHADGTVIPRGGLYVGERQLASECRVGREVVRLCMKVLAREHMVKIQPTPATHPRRVISICNYDFYQSAVRTDNPATQPTGNPPATHRQPTIEEVEEELRRGTRGGVGVSESSGNSPARKAPPPPPPTSASSIPGDTHARIQALAEAAPNQQDFLPGIRDAEVIVAAAADPEATLARMETSVAEWWAAQRDGRTNGKLESFFWLIKTGSWERPAPQAAPSRKRETAMDRLEAKMRAEEAEKAAAPQGHSPDAPGYDEDLDWHVMGSKAWKVNDEKMRRGD